MATNHKMTLDGFPLRINPEEMRWNFKMKIADQAAVGGKVIQILGLTMSDITLKGRFSPDKSKGDTEAWQAAERFRQRIKDLSRAYSDAPKSAPIRLTYPPRGWDFNVYVKSLSPYELTIEDIAPEWEMVLFPVGDGSRSVVKGIKDLYIKRLMDGIGWKQTSYNGPMTQALVDEQLGGRSWDEFMSEQYTEAFTGEVAP